jgi:hypothetical protein
MTMSATRNLVPKRGLGGSGWRCWLGLGLLAGVAGCGDNSGAPSKLTVYEVKGKVLLADGKPLESGHVYFVHANGATTSEGKIGTDGSFSLSTGNSGEGAPVGDYRVRVEPSDPSLIAPSSAGRRGAAKGKKLPFDSKYLDEDSSKLKAVVKPEPNVLEPFRLR